MTTPGTQGAVSPESMGERASSAVGSRQTRNRPLPALLGNTADQNRLKPCLKEAVRPMDELELESQKGNPGLIDLTFARVYVWRPTVAYRTKVQL